MEKRTYTTNNKIVLKRAIFGSSAYDAEEKNELWFDLNLNVFLLREGSSCGMDYVEETVEISAARAAEMLRL